MPLSVGELASRAGTTPAMVRRLSELGVLAPSAANGPFEESIVPRVRLALQLEASGIRLDDVGRAIGEKSFSLAFADGLFGRPVGMLDVTTRDMNAELSLSTQFVDDVRVALGATGAWDDPIREDDAELLRLLDRFVHQGLDERVAEQAATAFSTSSRRRPGRSPRAVARCGGGVSRSRCSPRDSARRSSSRRSRNRARSPRCSSAPC